MTRVLKAVDLFAGAGGFTTGAEQAGVRVVWAANHWPAAVNCHSQNHARTLHACQDLHQANWSLVPKCNLVLASPCCQGHSVARGKESPQHDASRSTAWAVVSCCEYHKPEAFIVENVPEFLKVWGSGVRRGSDKFSVHVDIAEKDGSWKWIKCPYGKPGDVLYVRETWRPRQIDADGQYRITYAADGHFRDFPGEQIPSDWKEPKAASRGNVSPLFMPAWAARYFIRLTAVRVQRLWEISEFDCIAEGAPCIDNEDYDPDEPGDDPEQSCRAGFADLWRRINGPESWNENPWVWAMSFKVVSSGEGR